MTHDEIIKLARESGLFVPHEGIPENGAFMRFAALVVAKEREECAKVCDETLAQHYMKQTIPERDESLFLAVCADCAAAIRARK